MKLDYQSTIMATFTLSLFLSLVLIAFCLLGRRLASDEGPGQFVIGNMFLFFAGLGLVYSYVFGWVIPQWGSIAQFATDIGSVFQ